MSLFRVGSIYLIGNLLNAVIPFMLLPILTRYLSQEEYGKIAMFQLLVSAFSGVVGVGVIGAATRKYFDNVSTSQLRAFNGACFHVFFISTVIISLFVCFYSRELSELLSIPVDWVFTALAISFLNFIIQIRLGQWQVRGQAKLFGILQVTSSIINVGLSLFFVVALKLNADGRIDASLITVLIMALVSFFFLKRDDLVNLFTIKYKYIKEALNFGLPLMPHIIGVFLLASVDRYVVNDRLGLESAAIYMVSFQLSSTFSIVFDAINKVYIPWLFALLKNDVEEEKLKVVKHTYLYFLFLLLLVGAGFLFAPPIVVFIAGEKYQQAGDLIGFLCAGQIFNGMYLMVTNYIFYSKKTKLLSVITIITGVINVVLMVLFLECNGLIGVAQAFAIGQFLRFLFTWILSANVKRMPWLSPNLLNNC